MAEPTVLVWDGARLRPAEDVHEAPLVAAESWLAEDGLGIGLELHRRRFLAACSDHAGAAAFWDAALAAVPPEGRWFPRIELQDVRGDPFVLRIRRGPDPRPPARLLTWGGGDPRRQPIRKGPDLVRLAAVRAEAVRAGAHDAVLTDDGLIAETTSSALVWWEHDRAFTVPPAVPHLTSTTVAVLTDLLAADGIALAAAARKPAELEGSELWLLNAVDGLRPVESWRDGPALVRRPGRREHWFERLLASRRRHR